MRQAGLGMLMAAMLPVMGAAVLPGAAAAEDAWIRIEAKRGGAAEAAIAGWRAKYDDVQTFDLPGGMTGIALGPLDAAAAAARMAQLKASGEIPADSYLTAPGGTRALAGVVAAAGVDPVAGVDATAPAGATAGSAAEVAATAPGGTANSAAPDGNGTPAAGAQAAPATLAGAGTHIQLQATPGRISADEALARWRRSFPEAGLFRLPNGVFAIALGADTAENAATRLAALKAERRIPSDAYLATTVELGTMIEGVGTPAEPGVDAAAGAAATAGGAVPSTGTPAVTTPIPDHPLDVIPPSAARTEPGTTTGAASTAGLDPAPATPAETATPAEPPAPAVMPPMEDVQRALRWAGFYDGPIDGKSGPGTRAAIDREIEATSPGQQQAEAMVALIARREAWRQEIGLARLDDQASGLGLMAPTGRLAFDRTERGLSIYGPKDGSGAALILTRQPGGQQEMLDFAGLVTALGWVPKPEREVTRGRVILTGADAEHVGHAEARVADGQVEGWVLIWPAADADNARRLAVEMGESFGPTPVAAVPATGGTAPDFGLPDAGTPPAE